MVKLFMSVEAEVEHDPQPDVMMVEEPEDVQLQSEPT